VSRSFGRVVQLSIGQRGKPSTLIEGLRIVFKIEKTPEKAPNNSTIEVYNLSEKTRALFEQKDAAVRLVAGYGDAAKEIFTGDVAVVTPKRVGPDIILSIEAADGLLAYQNAEADLSFAPGAKTGTILDQLTSAFGLSKGEVQGVDLSSQYVNGAVFSGKIRDHLDALLGKQGDVNWSIQDNQLQVLPKSKGSTRPAIILTPATGLIGSPFKRTVVNVDIAKKKEGKQRESGVSLRCLLNPEILPGRLVSVEAKFVKGVFKAEKVVHSGDTFDTTFYTDIEGVGI
jgi:hypothetical protein